MLNNQGVIRDHLKTTLTRGGGPKSFCQCNVRVEVSRVPPGTSYLYVRVGR